MFGKKFYVPTTGISYVLGNSKTLFVLKMYYDIRVGFF